MSTAVYNAAHREKAAAYNAAYRDTHREERAAYQAANLEKIRSREAAYREAHREETAAYNAAYYAAHREEIAVYQDARREEMAACSAAWAKANPEKRCAGEALRKARKLGNSIGFPLPDFEAILAEFGMFCHICGLEIPSMADLHMEHVIALVNGGPHSAENIKPSHALCNLRKGSKRLEDYHRKPDPG